ncbi:hypothetical protein Bpfe_014231, partial [Biomphalaria pfeifferi]
FQVDGDQSLLESSDLNYLEDIYFNDSSDALLSSMLATFRNLVFINVVLKFS